VEHEVDAVETARLFPIEGMQNFIPEAVDYFIFNDRAGRCPQIDRGNHVPGTRSCDIECSRQRRAVVLRRPQRVPAAFLEVCQRRRSLEERMCLMEQSGNKHAA